MIENDLFKLTLNNSREIQIKMELLNSNDEVLDELQGKVISGDINIDFDNAIRRSCNITMLLDNDNLIPTCEFNKIWLDKKFKLYVGLKDIIKNKIEWTNQGYYYFDKPNTKVNMSAKTLTFAGLDKMCFLNGQYNGQLGYINRIKAGTPLFDTVKAILVQKAKEDKYIINDTEGLVIPYDIEESATDSTYALLQKIQQIYMHFTMYYNIDGYFVYERIKDRTNDMIDFDFNEASKLIDDVENNPLWDNIKNKVIIWGHMFEDNRQIHYEEERQDGKYGIKAIGERLLTIVDDKIQTDEQALNRGKYELYKHGNLAETIKFTAIPVYFLDVGQLIYIKKDDVGVEGKYLIKKIKLPLASNGKMDVEAAKIYD